MMNPLEGCLLSNCAQAWMLFDGGVKVFSRCLAVACLLAGPLSGEVVIEFDAEKKAWPEGLEHLTEDVAGKDVCIKVGADVTMGEAYDEGLFGTLFVHSIRYAVTGEEERSATLKAIPADNMEASAVITVAMGKKSTTAFVMEVPEPGHPALPPDEMIEMNEKLGKLDEFNRLIKDSMAESREKGEVPRAVLAVSSTTPFGKMVDTLKLIQATGCHHGLVIVNDMLAGVNDIEIKTDPDIRPPVAKASGESPKNRIVVNVRNDGSYTTEDFEPLADEDAIRDYVAKEKQKFDGKDVKPRLHLRGDKEALFKHGRTAVRAAAAAGVNQVLFATFIRDADQKKPAPQRPEGPQAQAPPRQPLPDKNLPGPRPGDPSLLQKTYDGVTSTLKPRESDLNLQLPGPAAEADENLAGEPFIISIQGDGSIMLEGAVLDKDPNVRDLPKLSKVLRFYKQGVDAAGEKPRVQIYVSDDTEHQRVIDVLNALAGVGINSVTFTDLTEDKGEEDEEEK